MSLRIAKCDPPEAKTLGRREGESFVPNVLKRPVHRHLREVTGGREGKIAIPIFPKVIFVTLGEINFLFGVIEITFGETQEARFPPFSCFFRK